MTSNELKHEAKKQEWSMSIQEAGVCIHFCA